MRNALSRLLAVLPPVLLVLLLSGCGIIDYFYLPPPEETAQELFEAGNDSMREKRYGEAAESFSKLKEQFPFSPYTIEAELSLADAHFLDEDYLLAGEAYKEFETLHPRHEAIPYVLYQVGQSRQKAFLSIDRPTTGLTEAIQYYQRLRESYPGTEYAEKAKQHIGECRRLLAERELYIGDFFWRAERYGAAWRRYVYVVENFPEIEDLRNHAEEKGKVAYLKYRQQQSQQVQEQREGTWKRWFKWL